MQTTTNPLRRLRDRKRSRVEHLVSEGRVECQQSTMGNVDLDRCLSCPLLADIRVDEAGRSWVSCRPATHLVTAAELRAI
ncbi:MAG TPA: hypothetical protein VFZ64_13085 [Nocardioidaceae bacterium]